MGRRIDSVSLGIALCFTSGLVGCDSKEPNASTDPVEVEDPEYDSCPYMLEAEIEAGAEPWVAIVEEELGANGQAGHSSVIRATFLEGELQLVFVRTVDWFQAPYVMYPLPVELGEETFRQFLSTEREGWVEVPDEVMAFQEVYDHIVGCHPDLAYEPCGNRPDFFVRSAVTATGPQGCQWDRHRATIDLVTHEMECVADQGDPGDCDG